MRKDPLIKVEDIICSVTDSSQQFAIMQGQSLSKSVNTNFADELHAFNVLINFVNDIRRLLKTIKTYEKEKKNEEDGQINTKQPPSTYRLAQTHRRTPSQSQLQPEQSSNSIQAENIPQNIIPIHSDPKQPPQVIPLTTQKTNDTTTKNEQHPPIPPPSRTMASNQQKPPK
ncbi:MAG: hypothetical protein EZS28_000722 [Streblomastix strix]|uniref:Uncharacterized protein n=2 Tax=Streblomastix strix TaxID=222440 RepID=A0A5J4X9F3_9EUKA|nr:MAG: hypothetical protein EZS28_000722 [Streblomastix strix]